MEMIQVSDKALQKAAADGMDAFIKVFTDKYLEVTGGKLTAESMQQFNGYQLSLLAYHYFREEVMEGGFVQLIYNGYGAFIFDNPFAKAMRLFGAADFSKLLYKAKEIYDAHKADLTKERSDDDFMAMYERYAAFDDLEDTFIEHEEEITETIATYVDEHLEQFAEVI